MVSRMRILDSFMSISHVGADILICFIAGNVLAVILNDAGYFPVVNTPREIEQEPCEPFPHYSTLQHVWLTLPSGGLSRVLGHCSGVAMQEMTDLPSSLNVHFRYSHLCMSSDTTYYYLSVSKREKRVEWNRLG